MKRADVIPVFAGGVEAAGVYNAGCMLADDRSGPTAEDAKLRLYTGVREADLDRYAESLRDAGFCDVAQTDSGAFYAVSGSKDGIRVYAYLTKATGVARVIEEPFGIPASALCGKVYRRLDRTGVVGHSVAPGAEIKNVYSETAHLYFLPKDFIPSRRRPRPSRSSVRGQATFTRRKSYPPLP